MFEISDRKHQVLQDFLEGCVGALDACEPALIPWRSQMDPLLAEAFAFRAYADLGLDPAQGPAADAAILARARTGAWPQVPPAVGRLLTERLLGAAAVVTVNDRLGDPRGVSMPAGLSAEQLKAALLIFWCFEMPPLRQAPSGPAAGTA